MRPMTLAHLLSVAVFATLAAPSASHAAISEQEAHAIGVDAYIIFLPAGLNGFDAEAINKHRSREGSW
jgi:hypothetical protein